MFLLTNIKNIEVLIPNLTSELKLISYNASELVSAFNIVFAILLLPSPKLDNYSVKFVRKVISGGLV